MSEELKPCPFCGQDVSIGPVDDCTHYWYVCCEDCDITRFIFGSKQESIKIWNTRPAEDALKAEVERLTQALEAIAKNAEFWDDWDDSLAVIYRICRRALSDNPDTGEGVEDEP
ncbi:MAG: Lar family restriction alleviation protein [Lentisphaeria bacterium]|nr:Lar family restriction alleviation protein [Lentisphaeria bacterium]